jgi:hypothetical protein
MKVYRRGSNFLALDTPKPYECMKNWRHGYHLRQGGTLALAGWYYALTEGFAAYLVRSEVNNSSIRGTMDAAIFLLDICLQKAERKVSLVNCTSGNLRGKCLKSFYIISMNKLA